jgi:hypothetical protein
VPIVPIAQAGDIAVSYEIHGAGPRSCSSAAWARGHHPLALRLRVRVPAWFVVPPVDVVGLPARWGHSPGIAPSSPCSHADLPHAGFGSAGGDP